ncbi:hypothetical protein CMO89_00055 [Candidatus Woesearchaeota archaeon]|nr:hypothetical protein [Candidatus Woesearchaeota archaeon]|tara:strand:- start:2385 stop:2789 length:405 start_codon:yes stop_codon:yes gene_type:complete
MIEQSLSEGTPTNFIGTKLVDIIKEMSLGNDVAIVFSLGRNVRGFYPAVNGSCIEYRGNRYLARKIAENIADNNFLGLFELQPYISCSSKEPTNTGERFHILVASGIGDSFKHDIVSAIEYAWKERFGYFISFD